GPAHDVVGRETDDLHAGAAVAEGASAAGVRADPVPRDHVAVGPAAHDPHAVPRVAGDDVAGLRGRTADGVFRGVDEEHADAVWEPGLTRRVGADEVPGDGVVAARQGQARAAEAVDDQAADGGAAGREGQAVGAGTSTFAVQFDEEAAGEARLGGAVE